MDRPIIYPMAVPNSSDLLYGWQRAMVALSKLAQAVLGSGEWVTEFPVTPGTGMTVTLGPSQAFSVAPIDATPYGSLPANMNVILKQYLLDGYLSFPVPAPTTSGQSINYLLQLTPATDDTGKVILQYFDPANPGVAFGGPNNSGTAQATERLNTLTPELIAGTAATTGSQVSPTLTGIVGAIITVAYGQTSISASDITIAKNSAPIVKQRLPYAAATNANNNFSEGQTMDGDLEVSGTASIAYGTLGNIAGVTTGYKTTGLVVGWNFTNGQGEVDLLLGPQNGTGGLNIYQLNSDGTMASTTPIFALTGTGNLTLAGTLSVQAGTSGNLAVNYTQLTNGSFNATLNSLTVTGTTTLGVTTVPLATQPYNPVALKQLNDTVVNYFSTVYDVISDRSQGTTYTNSTGKPMMVNLSASTFIAGGGEGYGGVGLSINGIQVGSSPNLSGVIDASLVYVEYNTNISGIVPPGGTYEVTAPQGFIVVWTETY